LLKNSFGLSFRGALRHGISFFVGFWRGGILYSVRDGVFRSLFQQTANQALTVLSRTVAMMWTQEDTHPVKTFTSRAAIAAAIVFVAGVGWLGLKRYKNAHTTANKQPSDGSINGGVYTNNFFQFTVQFPAGWKVLSKGYGPQENAKAIGYVLVIVGSPDSQMHGTRWIAISATQRPASSVPLSGTADDLLKREADALKAATAMAPSIGNKFRLTGEPSEISIAGKRMARLDTAGQVDVRGKDYDYVAAQLAMIDRGSVLSH
jgi:hypothetical protein